MKVLCFWSKAQKKAIFLKVRTGVFLFLLKKAIYKKKVCIFFLFVLGLEKSFVKSVTKMIQIHSAVQEYGFIDRELSLFQEVEIYEYARKRTRHQELWSLTTDDFKSFANCSA
ncbi:MAG: hypothetical protein ACRC17_00190, partial [Culicoidibacterales bacterium]